MLTDLKLKKGTTEIKIKEVREKVSSECGTRHLILSKLQQISSSKSKKQAKEKKFKKSLKMISNGTLFSKGTSSMEKFHKENKNQTPLKPFLHHLHPLNQKELRLLLPLELANLEQSQLQIVMLDLNILYSYYYLGAKTPDSRSTCYIVRKCRQILRSMY